METVHKKQVRIGCVGLSGRGSGMLGLLLQIEGVVVPAVCDKVPGRMEHGIEIVKSAPGCNYDVRGYLDYKELLEKEKLDALMICTTWITHSRIAADAMRAGLNVAFEVGGAASVEECWELVRTSEQTGKFCMLLENCCYAKEEMAVYNMHKQGLFGELIHLQGGYQHDLREEITLGRETIHGRLFNFMNRNGELYPTHQLGPIAKLLNINRGNRFVSLTSMASKAAGLNDWIKKNKGRDYDLYNYSFTCGDVVTTMLKCAHGETVVLIHDCSLPRPYSRNGRVQGTNGIWMEDGNRIFIEGLSKGEHEWDHAWESFDEYKEKYAHPLWSKYTKEGVKAGHGGMDYLVLSAFVESATDNLHPPIDVYDTAVWMAVTCLSEQSVALGSMPVAFPDFTNGMWIDREPFRRGVYCLDDVCHEFFAEE
ncbi:MAG: Gfo/Idh/MocA family oxidoreductase [Oscillospiraceae bacterium]|jgi:predicted dehydrogenase|nr:Gfo/Idh/MocA family oxidoreductase [Oscillospiraceae bacterium]